MRNMKKIELILLGIMVLVIVIMSFLSKAFLNISTLFQILQLSAELGIMSIPMTLIMITGGIDLSITSTLALTGVIMGYLWKFWGMNIWLAVILAIIVSGIAGLFNGFLVSKLRIPALLATLGTWAAYAGLAVGIDRGKGVSGFPQSFLNLGEGSFVGIPYSLLIWAIIAVIFYIIVSKTSFGMYLFAIGNNEKGTFYSGIPVQKIEMTIYILAGLLAGLAGVIYTSRTATATSSAFSSGALNVVAASVLGGTDVKGGSGSVLGTVLGVLIIALIDAGLTLANIQATVQEIVVGTILISSIIFYEYVGKSKVKTIQTISK
ncbi:ABC transporter permease [Athalassotoga saccharophila]|uniref:ABC transporter permease n=1 Tax=Athalassotoga saccharophila TaxID=1441386 RepID=UPI00137AD4CA|nr:ABC transporter permease [Athalassotoga saccharophila]BBJ27377.1 ribose ABC transport system, permease protein RbsC [Athalassotoga saccharophila]